MANSLKIEHYVLGKTLGIGAFGKVKSTPSSKTHPYKVLVAKHELTGNDVAIKIINKKRMKNSNMSAKIKREIKLLRYFDHPNIIRLYFPPFFSLVQVIVTRFLKLRVIFLLLWNMFRMANSLSLLPRKEKYCSLSRPYNEFFPS